ncbi:MAG: cytoplasmic protein [Candidatus Pelagibacter sp.]|nr:cytoplasmic protein [Candidatus Pelagibacter sp.]
MMTLPLMPKATAVWLIENTSLTFKQIADFCGLHELEIKGIADGDVAVGIKAYNPILSNQLTRDEIEASSNDPRRPLNLVEKNVEFEVKKMVGPKYTPISQREDKPNAIAWLTKNYPTLTDAQICKLVGSTKNTVDAIRNRKHWNMSNISPKDPVMANLCTQTDLQDAIDKAQKKQEREAKKKEREARKIAKSKDSTKSIN